MKTQLSKIVASCALVCAGLSAGVGCNSEHSQTPPTTPGTAAAGSGAATAAQPASTGNPGSSSTPDSMPSGQGPSASKPPAQSGSPTTTPAKPPAQTPSGTPTPGTGNEPLDHHGDIRGKCSIKSAYDGDQACIPAPPEADGLQIHIGPKDYDNEEEVAKFLLQPGDETSQCWTHALTNTEDVLYQTSMLSGRPGTHHIINSLYSGKLEEGGFRACSGNQQSSLGSLPGASKPYMARGTVAPEYADVGRRLPPGATLQADMHYFNFTDKALLREFWMNLYYAKDIKREATPIRALGGFGWNSNPIPPGTDMVYKYQCPVKGDGHILNLLGHYHAHGKRFTATIKRQAGGEDKVFEMFDYLEPATFEYNSVSKNPGFSAGQAGAVSGQLQVFNGDIVTWECHIINDSDVALRYTNEVKTGEMCNLWGASLGIPALSCYLQ